MQYEIGTIEAPVKVKGNVLLAALGKQLRRAYQEVLGERLPLDIERAFEHLSDFAAKSESSSVGARTDVPQHIF